MMEVVANWKSLNNSLMRQEGASVGHVITYSRPRSRGYRAGKNGEVKMPLPVVPFKPFVDAPDVISVPFKCSLFPAQQKCRLPEYLMNRDMHNIRFKKNYSYRSISSKWIELRNRLKNSRSTKNVRME